MKKFWKVLNFSILLLSLLTMSAYGNEPGGKSPSSLDPAQQLYDTAVLARENGNLLKARESYERILKDYPTYEFMGPVYKELGLVIWDLIHSDVKTPESVLYEVQPADTLKKLARANGTTIELIKKRNHLTKNIIKAGQKLSLWTTPFNIAINKTTNTLVLKLGETVIKTYPVSTGKAETTTPTGEFTILHRYPNPVWFHKGIVVPAGSPENFLGTRWLGFDKPQYGIHGTIYPELIGQSVSGGCVRMKNEDVEELYDVVPIGTKVFITE